MQVGASPTKQQRVASAANKARRGHPLRRPEPLGGFGIADTSHDFFSTDAAKTWQEDTLHDAFPLLTCTGAAVKLSV